MSIFKRKCACSQPCSAPVPSDKEPRQVVFAEEGSLLSVPVGIEVVFTQKGTPPPTVHWL